MRVFFIQTGLTHSQLLTSF